MKKILITGGAGYIGSHVAVELSNRGHEVVILDDLSNSRPEVLDGIEAITGRRPDFYKIDISSRSDVKNFFKNNPGIGAVIHFAAKKAVGESVADPLKYYRCNLGGLVNLEEAMMENGVNNLIFSSSAAVYGEARVLPINEDHPIDRQTSPYGRTKYFSELIIKDTAATNPFFRAIALRYFNPIGAHESGLIGELPLGKPSNLVPFVTQTAVGRREELEVFGDDYDTPDGSGIRDYIHVVDLALAHIAAMERLFGKKMKDNFEVFNIGTGRGASVFEVIKTFEKETGQKVKYRVVGRREGDSAASYADVARANKDLGWRAERTLAQGLASAWKWERSLKSESQKSKVE